MNSFKLFYVYLGHVLLWTYVLRALTASLMPAWDAHPSTQKLLWTGLLMLPSLLISFYTLGMLSQLSAAFTFLLFIGLTHFIHGFPPTTVSPWLLALAALTAIVLYASALGFLRIDIYAWGYQARWLALAAAALAIIVWGSAPLVSFALAFALLAFALNVGASRNLWDYLIDVPMFFFFLYFLERHFWRS